ncbi:UNVERIFIED_CONTAM: hypothetical protein HDU68_010659 [Siphonaria sp. JEL0065]|nr:hypothetical protein HDU68_010659 [Siphonaria sp. JEL0065]
MFPEFPKPSITTTATIATSLIVGYTVIKLLSGKQKKYVVTPSDNKKRSTATDYFPSTFSLQTIPPLNGQVAIVTGGNTGIGYQTCKHLALNGAKVYMACRSKERALTAIDQLKAEADKLGKVVDVEFVYLDLSDLKQAKEAGVELAKRVKRVDVLVNNAGIMDIVSTVPFKLSKDGFESMFATNHLGHFQFTKQLLPVILKTTNNPRIVILASYANWRAPNCGIDFDSVTTQKDNVSPMHYYGQSKLANILYATELNARHGNVITINSVHPGVVDSELIRPDKFSFMWFLTQIIPKRVLLKLMIGNVLTSEQGAYASLFAATSKDVDTQKIKGKYLIPYGVVSDDHHPMAMDRVLAKKLWDFSEEACSKF